jgi:predicted transcriptional regulator
MNKELLRSVMALHGETNLDLAELLGISMTSVSNKINEKGSEFKQREIAKIRKHYNLTNEQVTLIFFS